MNILVACEYSGTVRDAFAKRGHYAVSCDLLPTDAPGPHFTGDVTILLYDELARLALGELEPRQALGLLTTAYGGSPIMPLLLASWQALTTGGRIFTEAEKAILATRWDMVIAHPPCTYICSSGLHWNKRVPGRAEKTAAALQFVLLIWQAPVAMLAMENPVGKIGTAIAKATQYVQPYEYGHDASKRTGLWLRGLPFLIPTSYTPPRIVDGRPRWGNQTDSGQNKLSPDADRWKVRSQTYTGIADAMAQQWA